MEENKLYHLAHVFRSNLAKRKDDKRKHKRIQDRIIRLMEKKRKIQIDDIIIKRHDNGGIKVIKH